MYSHIYLIILICLGEDATTPDHHSEKEEGECDTTTGKFKNITNGCNVGSLV